jgi:hypothetical protein
MNQQTQIICGHCGHTEEGPQGTRGEVYFPYRRVYTPLSQMPWQCPQCSNWGDVVLFGENVIQADMRLDKAILALPHVIASNEAYEARKAAQAAQPRPMYTNVGRSTGMPRTKTGRHRGPYGSQKFYQQTR